MKEGSLSLVGYQAEMMINSFHVDKTIISCKGIDLEKGITDSNELEAHIKKLMLNSANMKILVADNTKIDKISFARIDELSGINLFITDLEPDLRWKNALESMNIESYYKDIRKLD
jgi:DeoR/GlpR family transcriptional regulator of sugar metabolism